MEILKSAVVGLGRIASLLEDDSLREKPCTHAGAITAGADCRLVAGADIDEGRRRLFAERWKVPVYKDSAVMLAEHRPDILHIATHPDSHYDYCRLAAEYGVRAAVCEKPLADSLAKARKIAALHKSGRIRIITNHERRYSADYVEAAAILAEGRLGEGRLGPLLGVKASLYMGKNRRLIEVLWHDGTHLADALMFLTGSRLKHEKRWGAKLGARSGTAWLAGYLEPSGGSNTVVEKPAPFVIEVGAGRDHLVFEMEFSCERGRLRIGNAVFEAWESVSCPYAEKFRSLEKTRDGFDGPTGYFANMTADAAACARDPALEPRSSALDGLRVIEYLNTL
ncbi:MAG: Gfo/Idh/MocA family oxidoreductase [Spirochaetaceae bacterium]|jgi:predicted dehydrogenase|nr:Gfo/Idh/MocA family oxidoreductase [Spirochaetaceae bacterium]